MEEYSSSSKIIEKGIIWTLGSGKQVHICQDNWLMDIHPRPPKPKQSPQPYPNKVSDLFIAGTRNWDLMKLQQYITEQDIPLIMNLRPAMNVVSDSTSWFYSKTGCHTVKS